MLAFQAPLLLAPGVRLLAWSLQFVEEQRLSCSFIFLVTITKIPDKNTLRIRRVYFGSQFEGTVIITETWGWELEPPCHVASTVGKQAAYRDDCGTEPFLPLYSI